MTITSHNSATTPAAPDTMSSSTAGTEEARSLLSIDQQVRGLVKANPQGISRDQIVAAVHAQKSTVISTIGRLKTNGAIVEIARSVYGWPAAHPAAFSSDDGHALELTISRRGNDLGVLLESENGTAWIPAHALPDLRRRLGREQLRIERGR